MNIPRLTALVVALLSLPATALANRTPLDWWNNLQRGGVQPGATIQGTPVTPIVVPPSNINAQIVYQEVGARPLTPQQRRDLLRRLADQNSALGAAYGHQNSALNAPARVAPPSVKASQRVVVQRTTWRPAAPVSRPVPVR